MVRFFAAFLITASLGVTQTLPAFNWAEQLGGGKVNLSLTGLATDAQGNTYLVGNVGSTNLPVQSAIQPQLAGHGNTFVTKLDPAGNIVYSTYFGGSGTDFATAMTADASGNVYVTGTTSSVDFPTTAGTFAPSLPGLIPNTTGATIATFLFKLNADGSLGYSTYFTNAQTGPAAIAVDSAGSAYVTGITRGGLPTTPGAYQTSFSNSAIFIGFGPISQMPSNGFLTRFDSAAATLLYSTYIGTINASENAVIVASDGSAYVAGVYGVYLFNPTGSSLTASRGLDLGAIHSMALGPNSLYIAGVAATGFQTTKGAFQENLRTESGLPPAAIVELDPQLHGVLAATYFGGAYGTDARGLILDKAGNVYVGGYTSPLDPPSRTPFVRGFGIQTTGYVAELTGDLTTLLFASDFGDQEKWGVTSLALGPNGSFVLGGPGGWANRVTPAPPPALRIDSVVNAASQLSDIISNGETIVVNGAGFGSDSQLTFDGVAVPTISVTPTAIVAAGPVYNPASGKATITNVQVLSGGAASNPVLVDGGAGVSPGLFSADGSGLGQGEILNQDGTLNTPANPAKPGDRITVFANGVGPVSFASGAAVTQFPPSLSIGGLTCTGLAAVMGHVQGLPGTVYQLTATVPNPPAPPSTNSIVLQIDNAASQIGLTISVAWKDGA